MNGLTHHIKRNNSKDADGIGSSPNNHNKGGD